MAAGVPITNPVAGISIGLVRDNDQYTLLTDIIGDEDHSAIWTLRLRNAKRDHRNPARLEDRGISEEIIRAH